MKINRRKILTSVAGLSLPLGPGALSILGPSNIVSGSGGAGPPPYVASAVHFDGSTVVGLTDQALGLAADSPTGLVSVWLNGSDIFNVASGNAALFLDTNSFNCQIFNGLSNPNEFVFDILDASNADYFNNNTCPALSAASWNLLLLSWDMNFPAGSRKCQLFYGDAQQSFGVNEWGVAFNINYSDTGWNLASSDGGNGAGQAMTCDEADFQMWCGNTFLDLTVTANRRLFIDGSGKPVNPSVAAAVLGQQTVLLSGDATTFANNQGNAPATSVLTGTLTNASSHP